MAYLESVDNALRLLVLLARQGDVGVTAAASELGVAPSTAHRLLSTLRYRGFAVQASGRGYQPGPAFASLSVGESRGGGLEAVVLPHLERIREQLDETCHLMVCSGREARILATVEARQPLRVGSRTGAVFPAHLVSGGVVVLAGLGAAELDELYPPEGVPELDLDAAGVKRLHRELRTIHQRGYGLNVGRTERGIAGIATALRGADGRVVAAMSVSVPTIRYSAARVREIVRVLHLATDAANAELR